MLESGVLGLNLALLLRSWVTVSKLAPSLCLGPPPVKQGGNQACRPRSSGEC